MFLAAVTRFKSGCYFWYAC